MAQIKPFPAVRPLPNRAEAICELPYDVFSTEEARQIGARSPLSFLHVSKPEIDLPPGTDPYGAEVYARGKANFQGLLAAGSLRQDPQPCFYLYRQTMGSHTQTGLVSVVACEDYVRNIVKKHELTRPDKELDRVRHIEALDAQTGPVFLVYRANAALEELVALRTAQPPHIDFVAADGVRHTAWVLVETADLEFIQQQFAGMSSLYIADGHHRCAAAARVCQARRGQGHSAWFLAVSFPEDQVQILPYNRVLKDLNGLSPKQVMEKLDGIFIIASKGNDTPARKHELGFYIAGTWHTLNFRPRFAATTDPVEKLDVTLLQKYVLDPIFGITDPRTSMRINFVGGIRGTPELERLVNAGEYASAFSLYPTSIEDLMRIADFGGILPPKSTWFEPKLRDGLFSHRI